MSRIRCVRIVVIILAASAPGVGAQEVSQRQDVAVFRLSTYDFSVPNDILGSVDAAIQQVFINIGRFNVLGMTYRLGRGDIDQFIEQIRQYKQENIEIPEEVQMGREFFTEADLNRILGSFIVIVPTVTFFDVEGNRTTSTTTRTTTATASTQQSKTTATTSSTRTTTVQQDTTGSYHATLRTSFTVVNIAEMRAVAQADVETHGYDDDRDIAAREAVDGIPVELTYEVRKIEAFKLKSGVVEVTGRTIVMELGRDLGVMVGDEYEIVGTRVLESGRTMETRSGLLVVKEVSDEVSIAQVIYANPRPRIGDQLKEFPLLGASAVPYAQTILGNLMAGGSPFVAVFGARAVWNRGLFRFKPQVGVEVPVTFGGITLVTGGLPLNLYVGGQMDLYLGRLQLNPMVTVGIGGAIPLGEGSTFYLSHLGLRALVNVTYLMADKIKLSIDGGFAYWMDLRTRTNNSDYFGPILGAGAEIKL